MYSEGHTHVTDVKQAQHVVLLDRILLLRGLLNDHDIVSMSLYATQRY